ncbi:PIG-L deacetylase family protein [Beijerinckia sp. L45]|uniref:PIG-L deacetylase family protein n=1 Tax=Beijerinckia sp. L45 TaxID=1641855 RepID=UPI00131E31A5|nr:PIG-L deacetylase family protein [Beijerinckia sp. L45]
MTNRPEMTHTRWRDAPVTGLDGLIGDRPILILAPHADDETIGCGGLICQAVRAGIPIAIEFLTDGSRSHTSKTFDRVRLAALRQAEALKAVAHLGVDAGCVRFWAEEDSRLPADGEAADALAQALQRRIIETDAGAVFVTWIDDPHRDHKAAFSLALCSLVGLAVPPRLYAYPVWSWTIDTPQSAYEESVMRLAIGDDLATKRKALACHASQLGQVISDDPDGFSLSADDLALFVQPFETFIAVARPRN